MKQGRKKKGHPSSGAFFRCSIVLRNHRPASWLGVPSFATQTPSCRQKADILSKSQASALEWGIRASNYSTTDPVVPREPKQLQRNALQSHGPVRFNCPSLCLRLRPSRRHLAGEGRPRTRRSPSVAQQRVARQERAVQQPLLGVGRKRCTSRGGKENKHKYKGGLGYSTACTLFMLRVRTYSPRKWALARSVVVPVVSIACRLNPDHRCTLAADETRVLQHSSKNTPRGFFSLPTEDKRALCGRTPLLIDAREKKEINSGILFALKQYLETRGV